MYMILSEDVVKKPPKWPAYELWREIFIWIRERTAGGVYMPSIPALRRQRISVFEVSMAERASFSEKL